MDNLDEMLEYEDEVYEDKLCNELYDELAMTPEQEDEIDVKLIDAEIRIDNLERDLGLKNKMIDNLLKLNEIEEHTAHEQEGVSKEKILADICLHRDLPIFTSEQKGILKQILTAQEQEDHECRCGCDEHTPEQEDKHPCNCDHCKLMRDVENRPPGVAFA